MNSNDNVESASLEEIDREIKTWFEIINNRATQYHIPATHHRAIPHTPHSMHTQNLIAQFNALKRHSRIHGWTIQHYNRYRQLRNELHVTLLTETKHIMVQCYHSPLNII